MSYYDPRQFPAAQAVRSPYGTPSHPLTPRRRARRIGLLPMILVPTLGIGVAAVLGEHVIAPDPDITLQSGIGFATHDGTDLVLVPYDRHGNAGLIDSIAGDMFQVRIAAVELDTGDLRWDVQLSDELIWDAAVVAAGETYAYLATDDGLTVLELDDGTIAVEPGALPGLQGTQSVSGAAYAFDPTIGAVVALDVNGAIHTIALDALEAVPADESTAATWSGLLLAEGRVPDIGGLTCTDAPLDEDRTLRIEPVADGALGGTPVIVGPDGRHALGTRIYYEAGIVLDQTALVSTTSVEIDVDRLIEEFMEDAESAGMSLFPSLDATAAGAHSGLALIEHRPEPNGDGYALHVIDLDTGQVTASLTTGNHLGRAATAPGGHVVVLAAAPDGPWLSDLVIVAPDGSIDRVEIGETDFLGNPSL
ncbi:PA2928 family protein [Glycomyces sp. NRRL B-16210]|uniref:PA2928 family protein n=1 Tax=Glycomyces sp. NRRL B-16210 TaxID=1463821 RepID=UPI0004C1D686|nr:PA2928 family protein [Glycomyces sp. NRRL B-16210]